MLIIRAALGQRVYIFDNHGEVVGFFMPESSTCKIGYQFPRDYKILREELLSPSDKQKVELFNANQHLRS